MIQSAQVDFRLSVATFTAWLACGSLALAIVTSTPGDDHRVRSGATIDGVNLDGVGLLGFQMPGSDDLADVVPICTGSWISDRHLLSAAHCFDEDRDGEIDPVFSALPLVFATETTTEMVFAPVDPTRISLPTDWPHHHLT